VRYSQDSDANCYICGRVVVKGRRGKGVGKGKVKVGERRDWVSTTFFVCPKSHLSIFWVSILGFLYPQFCLVLFCSGQPS
jgi:hypothetical protein